ncbi:hypothetical protein [Rhizobium yanglingense]
MPRSSSSSMRWFALETEIAAIEAATGLSTGYRRSGRIIPLPKPHLRSDRA